MMRKNKLSFLLAVLLLSGITTVGMAENEIKEVQLLHEEVEDDEFTPFGDFEEVKNNKLQSVEKTGVASRPSMEEESVQIPDAQKGVETRGQDQESSKVLRLHFKALDKITGRVSDLYCNVGEEAKFQQMRVLPRFGFKAPPEDPPEVKAFVEVFMVDPKQEEKRKKVFGNWMFASSPATSALEDPIYDLWVVGAELVEKKRELHEAGGEAPDSDTGR